jgi:hypothetical protein
VTSFPQVSPPKPCTCLSPPHPSYMPRPTNSSLFYHPHNSGWKDFSLCFLKYIYSL